MICDHCNKPMIAIDSTFTSELETIDVYLNQDFVCINSDCALYSGKDVKNAKSKKVKKTQVG